jgi:hypothetical protein
LFAQYYRGGQTNHKFRVGNVKILYSNDNENWQNAIQNNFAQIGKENGEKSLVHLSSPINATYVKIIIPGNFIDNSYYYYNARLAEIKLF